MDYKTQIDEIIPFLDQNRELIDSHVTAAYIVDYFSLIPSSWYDILSSWPYLNLMEILSHIDEISDLDLKKYLKTCKSNWPNYPAYTSQVDITRVETYGMSPKKIHEATRLSSYIKSKSDLYNVYKSIDIGSGQGYLSHLLVTRGNMKVVAIEAKEHNCHESEKRGKIISEKLGHEGEFETVSMIVTKDNIAEFTREPSFLVGLHTCGDLSPICLKLFLADENIKGVINVGCCYHHLTEYVSFEARKKVDEYLIRVSQTFQGRCIDETLTENLDAGFPLSGYVKGKYPGFFLGRLPRTLSISEPQPSHAIDASMTFRKFQYRAAFQAFLQENFPQYALKFVIGNRIKRFDCFGNYAEDALRKMNLKSCWAKDELEGFYREKFEGIEKRSAIFWVMRSSLSGCIENLIILDRALFLAEQGAITEIMTIFDKHQSPRNIVISAFKP